MLISTEEIVGEVCVGLGHDIEGHTLPPGLHSHYGFAEAYTFLAQVARLVVLDLKPAFESWEEFFEGIWASMNGGVFSYEIGDVIAQALKTAKEANALSINDPQTVAELALKRLRHEPCDFQTELTQILTGA
jgi:hypothetical protein